MALEDIFNSNFSSYIGLRRDLKTSFNLNHKNYPIFKRYFDASNPSIVSVGSSTIKLSNHFFVTGEKVEYSVGNVDDGDQPIGIGTTYFGVGIGTTDKLPSTVYVIKVDENSIKLARSAEDALNLVPKFLNITSVGIGTSHSIVSVNQNSKSLISIDNIIQSPIIPTSTKTTLTKKFTLTQDVLYCSSINNFFGGDLIQIDDEIMKIEAVGVGDTNTIRVLRPWMGTILSPHLVASEVVKLSGDYNIVDSQIHFIDPPYGNVPISTDTKSPDERDWAGITSSSSFHGRVFMRSGVVESSNEAYYKNYIFDNISGQFNGTQKTFTLTSNSSNVTGIEQENGIILINNIFQGPGISDTTSTFNNYVMTESSGITSITFVGSATSLASDINTSDFPSGGIIVSVGSTEGLGYQPLVSAGGTAIVSIAGTISSVSIGNSGSGYRSRVQTSVGTSAVTVKVGVATTSSVGSPNIQFIGTATVSNGNIVSIAITNPGAGYTSTNPPYVIIDDPLPYSNIPLIYSSPSSGVGTEATVNVVVGQGSSVIDFEIKNIGYGYTVGSVLTVPVGGSVGIPTISGSPFKKFEITVDRVFIDKFSGWSIGELQPLDNIESLFNNKRVIFTLKYFDEIISIYAKKGSLINIQDNLLVFLNDILQVPGEGYIFNGGSKIQFTEPPKVGDKCKILFYKGSGDDVDVIFRDIIETVKPGDDITLTSNYSSLRLSEDERFVTDVLSIHDVKTNPYFGPGNSPDETILRPAIWCKQTNDLILDGKEVGKDRILYEPQIYPKSYLIAPVGIGSTVIFVDNIRPFFNPLNENNTSFPDRYTVLEFQNNVTLVSQDLKSPAVGTAVVSTAGTISSITIEDGGFGYTSAPIVSIQTPTGISTITSTAVSSITSGIVTSISITGVVTEYSQENPPSVLIEPPISQHESNKVLSYSGDFGIITGISTVSVGVASTGIVFDLLIEKNSYLRNVGVSTAVTGLTTVSDIQTGDYFVVFNSNVGKGVTSLDSNKNIVGIATSCLDCVYQVASVSIAQTSAVGFGITYVAKVTVSVSNYNGLSGIGYSNYYGNYSWGKIKLKYRSKSNSYNAYTKNGYSGISTGTILTRSVPLKFTKYST